MATKAGLLELQNEQRIVCGADSKCVLRMMLLLLTVFACQVLKKAPDVLENEEDEDSPRADLKVVKQSSAI